MKFFSVVFTAALATAVLAAPVEVAERQVEGECTSLLIISLFITPQITVHTDTLPLAFAARRVVSTITTLVISYRAMSTSVINADHL